MNPSPTQFLHWLRWSNLLIVSLTLAVIRYGLVAPALAHEGIFLSMDTLSFVLLSLYTLIVTFSGYVINDLYDQKTDAQNKPHKQAIGVWITEMRAKAIYLVLLLVGFLLAAYLDWHTDFTSYWIGIYVLMVFSLRLYSLHLKGSVLWGNVLVSLLCAAVIWIIPLAEKEALVRIENSRPLMFTLIFYTAFAALSNLLREIIKDGEDVEGDAKSGLKTLAVVHGPGASKKAALAVALVLLACIFSFLIMDGRDGIQLSGFAVLTLPFLFLIHFGLLKNSKQIRWKSLSRMAKLLMLGGLLGLLFLL
ncbi:MAG: UbiA family prenyltransferase [Bacteroidia bacterium]